MEKEFQKDGFKIQIDVIVTDKMVNCKATECKSGSSPQMRCVASLVILIVILAISVIFLYEVIAKFLTDKNSQTVRDPMILRDPCTQSLRLVSILKICQKWLKNFIDIHSLSSLFDNRNFAIISKKKIKKFQNLKNGSDAALIRVGVRLGCLEINASVCIHYIFSHNIRC